MLAQIFKVACSGGTTVLSLRASRYQTRTLITAAVITQVCRKWRSIALDLPGLWSNIFVDGDDTARTPEEEDYNYLMASIRAVGKRSRGHKSRLILRSPGFPFRNPGSHYSRKRWKSVLQLVFNRDNNEAPSFNVAELHLFDATEGVEDTDLSQVEVVTLEGNANLEAYDDDLSVKTQCEPKKIVMLEHELSSSVHLTSTFFSNVVDLAIFDFDEPDHIPRFSPLSAAAHFLTDPPRRGSLRRETPTHATLTMPRLKYLELYDCEQTFIPCIPLIRFPALEHLDWIVLGYQSNRSFADILVAIDAPHLLTLKAASSPVPRTFQPASPPFSV